MREEEKKLHTFYSGGFHPQSSSLRCFNQHMQRPRCFFTVFTPIILLAYIFVLLLMLIVVMSGKILDHWKEGRTGRKLTLRDPKEKKEKKCCNCGVDDHRKWKRTKKNNNWRRGVRMEPITVQCVQSDVTTSHFFRKFVTVSGFLVFGSWTRSRDAKRWKR